MNQTILYVLNRRPLVARVTVLYLVLYSYDYITYVEGTLPSKYCV